MDDLDACRLACLIGRTRDDGDVSATLCRGACKCEALFPGTAVAQVAHGVERLTGASRADHDARTREVVGQRVGAVEQQLAEQRDLLRLG